MGRLFRQALIAAVVLSLTAGGLALRLNSQQAAGPVDNEVDARREAIEQRIAEARNAGKLRGLSYIAILDQQHRLLIHQRQAEANGMTAEERRALLDEIERVMANIDKHAGK